MAVTSNYRALIEYDGTDYSGFQIQVGKPTIQGVLEQALQRLTQSAVRVNGAGRTDAGVHARGQVIAFRAAWSHGVEALQRAMNAVLPEDIAVRDVSVAADGFHARFSALSRTYIYSLYSGPARAPLLGRYAHYVAQTLDMAAMQAATVALLGEHDLAAFGQPPVGVNTVRVVHRATWRTWQAGCTQCAQFSIEANAFLRGMVRRLVGTLLEVGLGWRTVDDFVQVLAARDIQRAGVPAPACGLCLWGVRYGAEDEQTNQEDTFALAHWQRWAGHAGEHGARSEGVVT